MFGMSEAYHEWVAKQTLTVSRADNSGAHKSFKHKFHYIWDKLSSEHKISITGTYIYTTDK